MASCLTERKFDKASNPLIIPGSVVGRLRQCPFAAKYNHFVRRLFVSGGNMGEGRTVYFFPCHVTRIRHTRVSVTTVSEKSIGKNHALLLVVRR